MSRRIGREHGISVFITALSLLAAIVLIALSVVAYFEGRKYYWDRKVTELCEKDGGVTIMEIVTLSDLEYRRLGGMAGGGLPLPDVNDKTRMDYPFFRETRELRLRDSTPQVVRRETVIKRRDDGKALGKSVYYWRAGGDLPTGLFSDSSFGCPKEVGLTQQVFKVAEIQK
jgi:hypothetical protein